MDPAFEENKCQHSFSILTWAHSIAVERFHGMEQVGVRLPVGPQNNEEYFPLQEGLHIKEKGRDCSRPECLALELIKQQSSKLFNRIEHLFMLSDY